MQWRTYQRFHPLSHPLCGPSDEPTHYCTWSRSGWQGWLYNTGSQAYSSRYKLLQARSGNAAKVQVGQMEKFLAIHEKSRHLVKKEESGKCSNIVNTCILLATHLKITPCNLRKQCEWLLCTRQYTRSIDCLLS